MKKLRKMCKGKSCSLVLLFVFLAASCGKSAPDAGVIDSGDPKEAKEHIAVADELYSQRQDLSRARQALTRLRQARTADYGSYEATWKLARAAYFIGARTEGRESEDMFREGAEAGKIAVQLQPERPEGHFWLGANYGGSAERSTLAGLANVEDIRREMEAVIRIDEKFQGGSAYMVLGQIYLQAPKVLGGDTDKALQYLKRGLEIEPKNALTRVHLANAYREAGRDAEARKEIEVLLAMTPSPDYLPEYQEAVERAKKLQARLR